MFVFNFKDRVAIVTGGTRGIGKAISEAFLKAGAKVIITYVSNDQKAEHLKVENTLYSERMDIKKFDISNYDEVERFYDYVQEKYGSIDVLVNNAGVRKDSLLGFMTKEDWQSVLNVNLNGTFYMCKFAVKNMIRRRYGRIIAITSPSSHIGFKGQSNYAASKSGQVGMARALSKEVAGYGITVNCISPGFVSTELIGDISESLIEEYKNMIPLKKFATPEQIASGVLFLASEEASYITGTTLAIDGGI
ncbi:3-oxoacyl-ACP reductase FabG [bacterium]|nr:3-oxoacyl-ACP reductase FabG [bacterium]